MTFPWTDRLLNIPRALAQKYARNDTGLFDDLLSVGNLALVEAAARFDPALGKAATYLYGHVDRTLRNHTNPRRYSPESRWRKLTSLDAPRGEGLEAIDFLADPRSVAPDAPPIIEEQYQEVMRRLRPRERVILHLRHVEELTLREIGERLGVCVERVRQLLLRIHKRLRSGSLVHESRRGKPAPAGLIAFARNRPAAKERKRLAASAEGCTAAALARRMTGEVLAWGRYLIDHDGRRLLGPYRTVEAALTSQGVTQLKRCGNKRHYASAALGWPCLSPLAARILDTLLTHGPTTVRRLAEACGCKPPGVHCEFLALRRHGWLRMAAPPRPRHRRGTTPAVWEATEAAAQQRGPVCRFEVMRGKDAIRFKEEGYAVVAPPELHVID